MIKNKNIDIKFSAHYVKRLGAWHSPNTLPTVVHGHSSRIIWQSFPPIERSDISYTVLHATWGHAGCWN